MSNDFKHPSQTLTKDMSLVYTAMSKHLFYFRAHISAFVLEEGFVPLNPFMVFDYFLNDLTEHDLVRQGNNNLVRKADEIWVFGTVSNGALAEIEIAKGLGKPIRYFKVEKPHTIVPCEIADVALEEDIKEFRDKL